MADFFAAVTTWTVVSGELLRPLGPDSLLAVPHAPTVDIHLSNMMEIGASSFLESVFKPNMTAFSRSRRTGLCFQALPSGWSLKFLPQMPILPGDSIPLVSRVFCFSSISLHASRPVHRLSHLQVLDEPTIGVIVEIVQLSNHVWAELASLLEDILREGRGTCPYTQCATCTC